MRLNRLTFLVFLCLLGPCLVPSLCAQEYKRIDLEHLDGKLLDLISLENKQQYLVTSEGSYDVSNLMPEKVIDLKEVSILKANQKYTVNSLSHYYPITHGGYMSFEHNGTVKKLQTGDLSSGLIFRTRNGAKWMINNFLYQYKNRKWHFAKDLGIFGKYNDVIVYRDKSYLANTSEGLLIFDDHMELTQLKEEQGLVSNNCSSICVRSESEFYVGHRGAMSRSVNGQIEQIDLTEKLGFIPIVEMELDRSYNLWGLTSNNVFKYKDGQITVKELELESGELLISLQICDNQDIWILSDRAIYVIPNTSIKPYLLARENKSREPADLYQIRNKLYYSDGYKVHAYNEADQNWQPARIKKVPQHIIADEYGHSNLMFSGYKGIRIHKQNARTMNSINVPENEDLNNICRIGSEKYFATRTSLFQVHGADYKLLSHKEDSYFKVIKNEAGLYVFAQNGIYKMKKDKIEPLLASYNHEYPEFYNQIGEANKLITIADNSLHLIDTDSESLTVIDLNPLKVLDMKGNGLLVWVLCSKSLLGLEKSKLLQGKLEIVKSISLYENLKDAKLSKFSNRELWVSTKDKILKVNIDQPISPYAPNFDVHKIVSANNRKVSLDKNNKLAVSPEDLPLEITYSGANYWTDNIRYAYHVNFEGKNISEWKSEGTYTLSNSEPGRYIINAKFKDDIYGQNIEAPTIIIDVDTGPVVEAGHSRFLLVPILVISLLILLLMKGISKII